MLRGAACAIFCLLFLAACGTSGGSGAAAPTDAGTNTAGPCVPRGTKLVSSSVLPKGDALSRAIVNVITLQADFAFEVTVENTGCQAEEDVGVAVSVPGTDFFGAKNLAVIRPGERKSVVVDHLPLPILDKKLLLEVEIRPVPREKVIADNSADYPVRFVLT